MNELIVDASISELDSVLDFINGELENNDCNVKVQIQIAIAVEEIFVNIAHYAYPSGEGKATIQISFEGDPLKAEIVFIDEGTPYNPLDNDDPDITLSAEERQIGGLGIYMVKKSMDDVFYDQRDGKNILTIKKVLH